MTRDQAIPDDELVELVRTHAARPQLLRMRLPPVPGPTPTSTATTLSWRARPPGALRSGNGLSSDG